MQGYNATTCFVATHIFRMYFYCPTKLSVVSQIRNLRLVIYGCSYCEPKIYEVSETPGNPLNTPLDRVSILMNSIQLVTEQVRYSYSLYQSRQNYPMHYWKKLSQRYKLSHIMLCIIIIPRSLIAYCRGNQLQSYCQLNR